MIISSRLSSSAGGRNCTSAFSGMGIVVVLVVTSVEFVAVAVVVDVAALAVVIIVVLFFFPFDAPSIAFLNGTVYTFFILTNTLKLVRTKWR